MQKAVIRLAAVFVTGHGDEVFKLVSSLLHELLFLGCRFQSRMRQYVTNISVKVMQQGRFE